MNGISINEDEFTAMNVKKQNVVLFNNTEEIKLHMKNHIDIFEKHLKEDNFNFKLLRWMILGLAVLLGVGKYFNAI